MFFFSVAHSFQFLIYHTVACQRGGVSNEPLGQRQDTGPGILWSIHRWIKNLKKERTAHLIRVFFYYDRVSLARHIIYADFCSR